MSICEISLDIFNFDIDFGIRILVIIVESTEKQPAKIWIVHRIDTQHLTKVLYLNAPIFARNCNIFQSDATCTIVTNSFHFVETFLLLF